MSDIFISYASEDRNRVKVLADALETQGWSVWWDRTIPAGRKFDEVIDEALAGARSVVVMWSRVSITKDWVLEEAEEGRERRILIPVFIDNVKAPRGFRRYQAADLSDWDGKTTTSSFQKLVTDIGAIIGSPVLVTEAEGPAETEHNVEEEAELPPRLDRFKKGLPTGGQEGKADDITPIRLRSQPRLLSVVDTFGIVQQRRFSLPGVGLIGDFRHQYETQQLSGAKVIIDKSTGLMWQQSGPSSTMTFDQAKEYVARLNAEQFGGFSDWRLPTIEELVSLVEPTQKHGDLYIDRVFDDTQRWIRSADKESTKLAWGIVFYEGNLYHASLKFPYYVRAVRSIDAA